MVTGYLIYLIAFVVVATIFDYVTTLKCLSKPGTKETNQITVGFIRKFGLKKGLLIKTILVDFGVIVLFSLIGIYVTHFRGLVAIFFGILGVLQILAGFKNIEVAKRH